MDMNSEIKKLNLGDPDFNRGHTADNDGNVYNIPRIIIADDFSDYMTGLDEFPEDDYRDLSS